VKEQKTSNWVRSCRSSSSFHSLLISALTSASLSKNITYARDVIEASWNVMAHAQKPDFVFRRKVRVHLNRRGLQFSRLLAAEVCALAVVKLDIPCSEVVWRVLATHYILQLPLHFPFGAATCTITFQLESTRLQGRLNFGVPSLKLALCLHFDVCKFEVDVKCLENLSTLYLRGWRVIPVCWQLCNLCCSLPISIRRGIKGLTTGYHCVSALSSKETWLFYLTAMSYVILLLL
jgi:hypothetical protein